MRQLLLKQAKVQHFYARRSINELAGMWMAGFFKAASVEINKDWMYRAMENLETFADELEQAELIREAKEVYQRFVIQESLPMTDEGNYMIYEPQLLKGLAALSEGITAFEVSMDKGHVNKIENFLKEYSDSIVRDEVEEGSVIWKTFAWRKQSLAKIIEGLIDEGYSAGKLEIDEEKIHSVDTYPLLETILAMEQEGDLEVLELELSRTPTIGTKQPVLSLPLPPERLKVRIKWLVVSKNQPIKGERGDSQGLDQRSEGEILLDRTEGLRMKKPTIERGKNTLIYKDKRTGRSTEMPITPVQANLTAHLYDLKRKNQPAKSISELANDLEKTKKTLSTNRSRLERKLEKLHLKQVFQTTPDEKWELNSGLDLWR